MKKVKISLVQYQDTHFNAIGMLKCTVTMLSVGSAMANHLTPWCAKEVYLMVFSSPLLGIQPTGFRAEDHAEPTRPRVLRGTKEWSLQENKTENANIQIKQLLTILFIT